MRPDPTRKKIALFGRFGAGNMGNEATLQAMVFNLRRYRPHVEINCICSGPEKTRLDYKISAAPISARIPVWNRPSDPSEDDDPAGGSNESSLGTAMQPHRWFRPSARLRALIRIGAYPFLEGYRWSRGIAALKKSDLLVMTGTGMLGDHALHYEIFRWAVIAKLCRCKLLFVSVGAGPIRRPLSRCFVKLALALADYRSYRDADSKDHLEAIGVDVKNDAVYPDLAFSLPRAVLPANHNPGHHGIVIGVGLMNYYGADGSGTNETLYRDYIRRLASCVVRFLEDRYRVRILIGDVVYDEGVRLDLRRALEERGVKYEDGRIIDEPASSVDELILQLSSVDVVVSSRFHNLVLALMLEKPVFAISYHEKFQPLMDGVGLGRFCQHIERIDVDELVEKVGSLEENASGIKLRIARETESYRLALDEQYERILNVSHQARKAGKRRRTVECTPL